MVEAFLSFLLLSVHLHHFTCACSEFAQERWLPSFLGTFSMSRIDRARTTAVGAALLAIRAALSVEFSVCLLICLQSHHSPHVCLYLIYFINSERRRSLWRRLASRRFPSLNGALDSILKLINITSLIIMILRSCPHFCHLFTKLLHQALPHLRRRLLPAADFRFHFNFSQKVGIIHHG